MKKLAVVRRFLESDCPVKPGGIPIPGAKTGIAELKIIKDGVTPEEVDSMAACLGLVRDGDEWV